jgi:hypothetical protein
VQSWQRPEKEEGREKEEEVSEVMIMSDSFLEIIHHQCCLAKKIQGQQQQCFRVTYKSLGAECLE